MAKDKCEKCPTNHNITVEPKRPIGPYNAYVPVACRDCARRATAERNTERRRVVRLRQMLRRMVRQAWADCQVVPERIIAAARIGKRRAK